MLRQEVESSAAGNAPERQGGIADLPTGNLGKNYNSGGIVAFNGDKEEKSGPVEGFTGQEDQAAYGGSSSTTGLSPETKKRLRGMTKREREEYTERAAPVLLGAALAPIGGALMTPVQTGYRMGQGLTYGNYLIPSSASATGTAAGLGALLTSATDIHNSAADKAALGPMSFDVKEMQKSAVQRKGNPGDEYESQVPARPTMIPPPGASSPGGPAAAEGQSEDSGYTKIMNTLKGDRARAIAMMESGVRSPETVLTAEEYAKRNLGEQNAYLKARNLPTAEESMKERIDNLATASKEARNNRDADRWMAAAQGFFAMAGGKSQYAMQNMAEGLGMGTKELRAVEQDYRKVDQLLKDKTELLKEATRQEARGDFAKGEVSRKEAEERNKGIADIKLKIGASLLETFDRTAATATAAEGVRSSRADAAAGRRADTAAVLAAKPYDIGRAYADAIDKVNLIPDPAERAKARAALDADFSSRVSTLNKNTEPRDMQVKGALAKLAMEKVQLRPEFIKGNAALQQKMMQDAVAPFGIDLSGGAAPVASNMAAADKILSGK